MKQLQETDQAQLQRIIEIVSEILGADAIGAYLFGSAVLGGLHPHSDLDVLVVARRPTVHDEKAKLVRRLLEISGHTTSQGRWRHVEVTIVVERDIKPWRYPPQFDFQYGDWLRSAFERGNVAPWKTPIDPDLTLLIEQVRLAGVTLIGPAPDELFEPISHDHLVQAMVSDVDRLRSEVHSDTRNVILTLARMWSTLATGTIRSKDAAADWVLKRLSETHHAVLSHAKAVYLGEDHERWDALKDGPVSFADYVIGRIKELANPSTPLLPHDDTLTGKVIQAIQEGETAVLERLLAETPALAGARIVRAGGDTLTLLHVATDWPGHFPNVAETIAILAAAGADVNARFSGPHAETPLHFAASTDDIDALNALLDLGADIEAAGSVIAGGTPLDNAVAFSNWKAGRRLVERGATTALWHAAALGLMEQVEAYFNSAPQTARYPWGAGAARPPDAITVAFWCACHGGQLGTAQYLMERGAELNWASVWDGLTPLDAAQRAGATELAEWLRRLGAKSWAGGRQP